MNIEILTEALEKVLGNRDKYYLGYCNSASDFSLIERNSKELAEEIIAHLPKDNSKSVVSKLIEEFENPDNHSHQRNAIEDAKEYLEIYKSGSVLSNVSSKHQKL